jgi:hypothetical protein
LILLPDFFCCFTLWWLILIIDLIGSWNIWDSRVHLCVCLWGILKGD